MKHFKTYSTGNAAVRGDDNFKRESNESAESSDEYHHRNLVRPVENPNKHDNHDCKGSETHAGEHVAI